jgi:hypothetical protein
MEDDLNLSKMKDNINIFKNGRGPQYFQKWKLTRICWGGYIIGKKTDHHTSMQVSLHLKQFQAT